MTTYLFYEGEEQPHRVAKNRLTAAYTEWLMGMGELAGLLSGRLPRRIVAVRFI